MNDFCSVGSNPLRIAFVKKHIFTRQQVFIESAPRHVTFVGHQDLLDVELVGVRVDVLQPNVGDVFERLFVGDVENDDDTVSALVVRRRLRR